MTSIPPSHLKKYRHPKDTSPYQDSKEKSQISLKTPIIHPYIHHMTKIHHKKTHSKIEKATSNSVKCKLIECDELNGIQLEDITYHNSILPDIVDTQEIRELDTKELQKNTLEEKPQTKRVKFAQNPDIVNISPRNNICSKAKNPSLLYLEGMDQLQEALNTFNVHNKQQTETNAQKPHSNVCNSTHKSTKQKEENVFKDDLPVLKPDKPSVYNFHPLTVESCTDIKFLINIPQVQSNCTKKYINIGGPLSGAPKSIKKISRADHNCYFQVISFAISGSKEYHKNVRNALCNFISLFNYQLSPFLSEGEGEGYLKSTDMQKFGTWATETEILATAKMFH